LGQSPKEVSGKEEGCGTGDYEAEKGFLWSQFCVYTEGTKLAERRMNTDFFAQHQPAKTLFFKKLKYIAVTGA